MNESEFVLETLLLEDLFARWPETAVVFQRHQMACVGCVVAPFYTVADAAQVYDLDPAAFVQELRAVIERPQDNEESESES